MREVGDVRLQMRLAILLPLIFASFHFIAVGLTILTGGENGDGALGLVLGDLPLFALCAYSGLGRYLCPISGAPPTPLDWTIFLLAGTVTYAIIGFVIGVVIDRIRVLIARRWG